MQNLAEANSAEDSIILVDIYLMTVWLQVMLGALHCFQSTTQRWE
jgi:hypothetical protein